LLVPSIAATIANYKGQEMASRDLRNLRYADILFSVYLPSKLSVVKQVINGEIYRSVMQVIDEVLCRRVHHVEYIPTHRFRDLQIYPNVAKKRRVWQFDPTKIPHD
jgi:hypothetical protein